MKIAVLVAGARFDSQQRIINGIMESAISDGADIYLLPVMHGPILLPITVKGKVQFLSFPILKIMMGSFCMAIPFITRRS